MGLNAFLRQFQHDRYHPVDKRGSHHDFDMAEFGLDLSRFRSDHVFMLGGPLFEGYG